jgi:hypothetical protein
VVRPPALVAATGGGVGSARVIRTLPCALRRS